MTRLLSWNILQGGGRRSDKICEALSNFAPDIVVLQEIRNSSKQILNHLNSMGLKYQFFGETQKDSENSILIASNRSFDAGEYIEEREGQCHILEADIKGIAILGIHFPQKAAQVPLFQTLLEDSSSLLEIQSLIVGDLNCGIAFKDSTAKTFVNEGYFKAMLEKGWIDLYRQSHGEDAKDFSWISPRTQRGFRYDHALASKSFAKRVKKLEYDHSPREQKLSDHSALLIEFE